MQWNRRKWIRLLIVAGALGGMVWIVARLGPVRVLDVAARADPVWLALSLLPVVARFLIWGHKWRRILRRQSTPVPYGRSLRILLSGSFVNLTTPTAKLAGGLLRAVLLRRHHGWGLDVAYGRSLADQATNAMGTVALYGVLAVGIWLQNPSGPHRTAFAVSGSMALTSVAVALALRGWAWNLVRSPRLGRLFERLTPSRLRERTGGGEPVVQTVLYPLLGERPVSRTLLVDVIWAAISFASICVANALVLRALGVDADPWVTSTAVVLGYFAGIAVGAWGGIGVTEAAITVFYIQAGIPPEVATAGALLHRAGLYSVVLVWGGFSLLKEGRRKRAVD